MEHLLDSGAGGGPGALGSNPGNPATAPIIEQEEIVTDKSTLTKNQLEALRLLRVYQGDSRDFWALSGPAKGSCRAHIMSALAGERVPQRLSGVGLLQKTFLSMAGVAPECMARMEDAFWKWFDA